MEKYNVGSWRWTLAEDISQGEQKSTSVRVCGFLSANVYSGRWGECSQNEIWTSLQESLWKYINNTPTLCHISSQYVFIISRRKAKVVYANNIIQLKHINICNCVCTLLLGSLSSWEHISAISICSCFHLSLTLSPSPNHRSSRGIGVALKNSRFVRCSHAVDIHGKTHPPALISQLTTLHAPCQPISFET